MSSTKSFTSRAPGGSSSSLTWILNSGGAERFNASEMYFESCASSDWPCLCVLVKLLQPGNQGRIELLGQVPRSRSNGMILRSQFHIKATGVERGHQGEQAQVAVNNDGGGRLGLDRSQKETRSTDW